MPTGPSTTSPPATSTTEPVARPFTSATPNADGSVTITIHRHCNGCNRDLGDATAQELAAADAGVPLPDVRAECGCTRPLDNPPSGG